MVGTEATDPRRGLVARVIDFSGRQRVLVFIAALALVIFGVWSARRTPLDALPDLSDTQVIVATEWMGRNPTLIEDQVTYPIVTSFLGAPRVKTVRGFTMFGMSFVYVIFEDGTDVYWARSRVLEYLSKVREKLPEGVTPQVGPDATSVGWVYQYALVDETGQHDLQQLRAFQDWQLRYWLQAVPGVAEVASVGGFEKEYQVEIDPVRMKGYGISVGQIAAAIRGSNDEVGGRVVEMAQHEYAVRGRGYVQDKGALELAVITTKADGTPIRIQDVAEVVVGGNIRRGVVDLDGRGEAVGGIVVMRYGENALEVINRVKAKIHEVQGALPPGVKLVPVYDRSQLIKDSVATLTGNLAIIVGVVLVVIAVFLFHLRSSFVSVITLIVATVASFIAFWALRMTINIMSLAGVILALGDMVDSAVVLVENAHKKIEEAERSGDKTSRTEIVIGAARDLGPSMFGALLVLTVAFLPVFVLEGEEGRLFRPLALAKTASMAFASILAVTLVPALMVIFLRGKIRPERANPINRLCIAAYRPMLRASLRLRWVVLAGALVLTVATALPFTRLGSEFMPPLYEGDLLYMPITVPSMPIDEARRALTWQDAQIRSVPEVAQVFGKAGRAETALDPAPLSMFETIVRLKPKGAWRPGMTQEKIVAELEQRASLPGVQGAWTMPIKARIDMLSTGIRTPVGVKVFGPSLDGIVAVNDQIERVLRDVPGTRSVYAERELGGFFLDVTPDRVAIARYGVSVRDVLDVVESAIGGMDVSTTFEGRERYKINVRYPRDFRQDLEALRAVLVPVRATPGPRPPTGVSSSIERGGAVATAVGGGPPSADGMATAAGDESMNGPGMSKASSKSAASPMQPAYVPLGQLAKVETVMGPPMIKSEMGSLAGFIYVDLEGRDVGGWVDDAKASVAREVKLPPGYTMKWTGQYELLERVRARLALVLPLTLAIVFAILWFNFRGVTQTLIVMSSVPFAAVGAIWTLWALGFNTSIAVWVGMIALLGVAAETASVMVVYLDDAWQARGGAAGFASRDELVEVAIEAGSKRVRPLLMTVMTNIFGLLPILIDTGVGADVAKRIAAPMWGGLVSLTLLTLLVIPAAWVVWRGRQLRRRESVTE
ncbi:MAG: efflux RND transporter permease subunit [Deltaproteobacteria bacterium]|nr:efflux RND transporter permease subunit [Deltaproteobacteria bacterium]